MSPEDPTDIQCRELIALVTDYLEGVLPARQRDSIETHLEECEWCERYIEQTRQTAAALGRVGGPAPDPDSWERALRAFREHRDASG